MCGPTELRAAADLLVAALARRAAMSPRHGARHFADAVGTTPARHVEGLRLEAAWRRLGATALSVEQVAEASGFGSAQALRRVFRRHLGVTPGHYRTTFGSVAA